MPKWMDSARDFLGLGEDPYYDDDYDLVDDHEDEPSDPPGGSRSTSVRPADAARSDDAPRESDPVRPNDGGRARDRGTSGKTTRQRDAEPGGWDEGDRGVRMITPERDEPALVHPPSENRGRGGVSAVPASSTGSERGVVRPLPTTNKPEVVSPNRFDDVQTVADAFKAVQPVIINLQGVDRDLSRRLIDFASGLCYGLEGEMERVADQVFLLTPRGAEVSADDRLALSEGNLGEYSN